MTKTQVIDFIKTKIFENVLKLVTGQGNQDAVVLAVQESVNQDQYDSDAADLDIRITNTENATTANTANIATNTANIATNAANILTNTNDIAALTNGQFIKGVERAIGGIQVFEFVADDMLRDFVFIATSLAANATIKIQKVTYDSVFNPVDDSDNVVTDVTRDMPMDEEELYVNKHVLMRTPSGEFTPYAGRYKLIITVVNCTVDMHYYLIKNFA